VRRKIEKPVLGSSKGISEWCLFGGAKAKCEKRAGDLRHRFGGAGFLHEKSTGRERERLGKLVPSVTSTQRRSER